MAKLLTLGETVTPRWRRARILQAQPAFLEFERCCASGHVHPESKVKVGELANG